MKINSNLCAFSHGVLRCSRWKSCLVAGTHRARVPSHPNLSPHSSRGAGGAVDASGVQWGGCWALRPRDAPGCQPRQEGFVWAPAGIWAGIMSGLSQVFWARQKTCSQVAAHIVLPDFSNELWRATHARIRETCFVLPFPEPHSLTERADYWVRDITMIFLLLSSPLGLLSPLQCTDAVSAQILAVNCASKQTF